MMRGTIAVDYLSEILDSVTPLSEECRIQIHEDYIRIPVIDRSNAAQADIRIDSSAFEEYEADEMEIYIGLEMIEDIVDISSRTGTISLEVDDRIEKLKIETEGQEFEIGLINSIHGDQSLKSIDFDLTTDVTIDRSVFYRAIVSADLVSDEIVFKSNEERGVLILEAKGDNDTTRRELYEEDLQEMNVGQCSSIFSLAYLNDLNSSIPDGSSVRVEFGEDRPARFHYDLVDSNGKVEYLLSPRIKSN